MTNHPTTPNTATKVCIADGCERPSHTRGCCRMHYSRLHRYGDITVVKKIRHGLCYMPENQIWHTMKQRCFNPKSKHYDNYGGRGITMCDRWRDSFEDFYKDMGARPSTEHSIDRIDNDGNYEPNNCRWATRVEQLLNTRVKAKSGEHNIQHIGKKFVVKLRRDNVIHDLGGYSSLEEAIEVRDEFRRERGEI